MPIYEFVCRNCSKNFEELVFRSSEVENLKCPDCNSKEISRQMSMFSSNTKASVNSGKGCSDCHSSPAKCASCH